jgi:DNA-binding LacI/PurR family transcriptional regulator
MHQDCNAIGVIAMATMLERLEHPDLPIREILSSTRLVERNSCLPLSPREAALAAGGVEH